MRDSREWLDQAACAPVNIKEEHSDIDWYSTDFTEKYRARAVCQSECPVRKECISDALNNFDIWGVHGGVDDYEIRRDLSVDSFGKASIRNREPRCPFCMAKTLTVSSTRVGGGYATTCDNCGLKWKVAVIHPKLRKKKKKVA